MQFWFDIISLMFNTMIFSFLTPFFWLVIFIVFMQYRRTVAMEKKLFGRSINSVGIQTLYSVLFGIMGGLFGSFFLLLLGISLDNIGIIYLWPVAILLFMLNPRFLCFAYAGGILAMASLFLQAIQTVYPALGEVPVLAGLLKIHLPGLLALVGILHLTEAFLILISGHRGASPIFLKAPSGKIVGGFSMQRFWPLPLMGLWALVVAETSEMFVGGVAMPEWWPLLGTVMSVGGGEKVVYLMVPLVAGLGYSELALSSHPREKRVKTAFQLALYSLVLSLVAVASVYYPLMIIAATLIAPLGHEFLIKMGNKAEFSGPPLFHAGADGPQIMALIPGAAAERSGLQAGDRLLELNGFRLRNEMDFWQILSFHYGRVIVKFSRGDRLLTLPLQFNSRNLQEGSGIIFSPGPEAAVYVELKSSSLRDKLRRRFRKNR
ncbi:MAG: PDZ domain-containing protein [Bacillota bacterium]